MEREGVKKPFSILKRTSGCDMGKSALLLFIGKKCFPSRRLDRKREPMGDRSMVGQRTLTP
jgi:hypothetical protein